MHTETLFRLEMDTTGHSVGEPKSILTGLVAGRLALVSPSGKAIAFCYSDGSLSGVGVAGSNGERPRLLSPIKDYACSGPNAFEVLAWLSEGELLVHDRRILPGAFKKMSVSTGALTVLQEFQWANNSVAFSYAAPSQEVIFGEALARGASPPEREIHALSLVTGKVRVVAKLPRFGWLTTVPDGTRVVFSNSREIWMVGLDGRDTRLLISRGDDTSYVFNVTAVSRNGTFVLYKTATNTIPVVWATRMLNVATLETWSTFPGGNHESQPWRGYSADWSPDGSFLIFSTDVPAKRPQPVLFRR